MLQNTEEKERLDDVILEKLQSADDGTRILLLPYLSDQAGSKVVEIFLSFKDPNKPELMLALAQTARRVFADMPAEKEQEVFELATIPEVKACFLNWMNQKDPEQFDRQVETWLSSDKKGDRRAGILAIGEVGSERHIDALDKVLASETEPCVLALTLHGLRRFQTDRRVVELVKPFLRHPEEEVRLAAIEALPLDEDVEVNTLIQAIGDPAEKVRTRAIERLVKLPAEKQHLLVAQMGTHSRWVRDGLFEIAEKLDLKNVDVFTFCRNQIKVAYEAVARSEFIAGKPETPATRLMLEHLEEVRKQRVINAIMGVAAKDPEGQVAITLRGLNSDKERDRSDSIEALETLLDKPLANLALPQLDNRPNAERLAIGRKLLGIVELSEAETIKACLNDPSWVTVIMTLECLATWKEVDRYRDTIENIAASDYGGVAHTAKHALHSADGIHEADLSCLIDRINNIRKVELFAGLTIGQLAAVAWQSDVEAFGPDQVVASAERPDRGLLMVVAGEITFQQVHKDADSTRELHRIGAGDWFGAAIMFGMKPPASLVAKSVGEVLLIHLDRETFHSLANQYPGLALQVCNGLAKVVGDVLRDLKSAPRDPEVQKDTHTTTLEGSYCTSAEECSLVDRIFFLRQIDLFSQLDNASVTALAMIGEELALEKGDQVLGSDVGASGLFLIPHGDLSFHRGQELFDRKGPGGYFGLPTLFGMPVDDFVVTAEEKTRLIRIPPEEFRASVMDHPIIAIKACEKLSQLQGSLLDQVLQANEDAAKSGKTPG
jgi:CRP-like cAMP-binding protein/HEAT repeat protein